MKFKGAYNISGFSDLCSVHANGEPIYIVNGQITASFDLLVCAEARYDFWFNCKAEVEKAIQDNLYMFDIVESNEFYYPNDNMLSSSNAKHGIKGQILTLKEKYR